MGCQTSRESNNTISTVKKVQYGSHIEQLQDENINTKNVFIYTDTFLITNNIIYQLFQHMSSVKICVGMKSDCYIKHQSQHSRFTTVEYVNVSTLKRQTLIWPLIDFESIIIVLSNFKNNYDLPLFTYAAKAAGVSFVMLLTFEQDGSEQEELESLNIIQNSGINWCMMKLPKFSDIDVNYNSNLVSKICTKISQYLDNYKDYVSQCVQFKL